MKRNIVLIGATGSIGKNLATFLANHNDLNLIIMDRESSGLKGIAKDLNVDCFHINLKNRNEISNSITNVCERFSSSKIQFTNNHNTENIFKFIVFSIIFSDHCLISSKVQPCKFVKAKEFF